MIRISDDQAERAFEILKSGDHAIARAAYEYSDRHLKVVLANASKASNAKTVSERQEDALASQDYADALKDYQLVCKAYFLARDKRDAASAVIDAYRTQQSDLRAMGRVG